MFVATNRIKIKRGHGAELEERFARRAGVEKQPGFVSFELWRQEHGDEHEEYVVVTHWESEATHAAWTHSDAFRAAHAGARADFLLGPGEVKRYDVRLASSPAAPKTPIVGAQ
ncbi:MAG: antibiotic biosynthesis monooxygenase [Chloroflexi bacterium]|nr:antibiotic biosynthesis monooxygenase [Chloroflexota bacterium]